MVTDVMHTHILPSLTFCHEILYFLVFFLMIRPPPRSPLSPYPTLFRSDLEPIPKLPPPVETWVADAFAPELLERLRAQGTAPYDVVLSDLAPKTSGVRGTDEARSRSEEHTSELQSQSNLVCRLLLEKKH